MAAVGQVYSANRSFFGDSRFEIPTIKQMLQILVVLGAYFFLAIFALGVAFVPGVRVSARSIFRRTKFRVATGCMSTMSKLILARNSHVYIKSSIVHYDRLFFNVRKRDVVVAGFLVTALPLGALAWRHWHALESFDHTDAYQKDERISSLLTGEKLIPPAALPPEVFATREVTLAMPSARFASRDWMLLDDAFRQRVLMLYRVMREQHGYEMVLLEGYRSPERQAQLATLGPQVTQAGPGRSYHQHGLAVDSAFLRDGKVVISEQDGWAMRGYELYGKTAALLGLTWGGGWKGLADLGHVEWRRPGVMLPPAGKAP